MKKKVIISLLALFNISFALDQEAEQIYNQMKSAYGSKGSIRENIVKPSTGTSNFKTLDNSITFSAPLSCPSQKRAITITFSSQNGDYVATIQEDTNLDGSFDYTYTTPNISGVCTNGIVSCNPAGSWNNCKYYYWTSNNRKVSLVETNDTSLVGTCSCSNISCGITTLDQPLFAHIGGGIGQAVAREDSRFVLSKSKWNGNTLELFGQDMSNCSDYQTDLTSYGEKNPVNYYNNQSPPSVSIADVVAEQGDDPYSPYNIVSKTTSYEYEDGKQIGIPDTQECTIRNIVSSYVSTEYENCNTIAFNGKNWCVLVDKANSSVRGSGSVSAPTPIDVYLKPTQSLVAIFYGNGSICDDDWSDAYLDYTGDYSGSYHYNCRSGIRNGKTIYIANNVDSNKYIRITRFKQAHSGGGGDAYHIRLLKSQDYSQEYLKTTHSDNCPSGCTLKNEWICDKDGNNCIQTVKDGNPLNVNLQNQCFLFQGQYTTYMVCSDGNYITAQTNDGTQIIGQGWFFVKRQYNCGTQNLDIDLSRTKNVVENSTINGKKITYTDLGQTDTADLSNIPSESCLTPICTVKIPIKDNQVFNDKTNRSQTAGGSDSYDFQVRNCIKNGSRMTCPVDTSKGEIIEEDCSCDIKDQRKGFQKAITTLKVVEEASKDMICSSSAP